MESLLDNPVFNLALISALSFLLAATKTTDAGAVGENAMDIGRQRKDYEL